MTGSVHRIGRNRDAFVPSGDCATVERIVRDALRPCMSNGIGKPPGQCSTITRRDRGCSVSVLEDSDGTIAAITCCFAELYHLCSQLSPYDRRRTGLAV